MELYKVTFTHFNDINNTGYKRVNITVRTTSGSLTGFFSASPHLTYFACLLGDIDGGDLTTTGTYYENMVDNYVDGFWMQSYGNNRYQLKFGVTNTFGAVDVIFFCYNIIVESCTLAES